MIVISFLKYSPGTFNYRMQFTSTDAERDLIHQSHEDPFGTVANGIAVAGQLSAVSPGYRCRGSGSADEIRVKRCKA